MFSGMFLNEFGILSDRNIDHDEVLTYSFALAHRPETSVSLQPVHAGQ